jgi:hypothetical protein
MIGFVTDLFDPTEHQTKSKYSPHEKFTQEEDQILKALVPVNKAPDWQWIAASLKGRTPRQC